MSRIPSRLITALGGLLFASGTQALPLIDASVGARYWQADPSGNVAYESNDQWSTGGDLGLDAEGTPNVYARAAIPLITADLEYTDLSYSGQVERSGTWGGQTVNVSRDASLDAQLLHAGAMFSPPVPILDLGIGAGATRIDADAKLAGENASAQVTVPVAKAEIGADVPILPLDARLRANGIGYNGDTFYDVTAEVGVTWGVLRFDAGYRQIAVDFESNDLTVDSDFSGPFAGAHLSF